MRSGTIVEYIDRKQIVCAVVLGEKNQRLRMLTQNNREVTQAKKRLAHISDEYLDLNMGRDALVERLRAVAAKRKQLQNQIDIKTLWEVLHTEATWIDLKTIAELCFDGQPSSDHTSAVMRALFEDRLYFKFDTNRFFPNAPEQVARVAAQIAEEARRSRIIEEGSQWIRQVMEAVPVSVPSDKKEIIEILKSFYLFGKQSPHYEAGKEIVSRSGLDRKEGPFYLLVKLGVWDKDENLNLHRFGISDSFPPEVMQASRRLVTKAIKGKSREGRRDLTCLSTITIDGSNTVDFDDAVSIELNGNGCRLGVHITDIGHVVEKGNSIDEEALSRASSIYMPDKRISMLPPILAENLCSLKEGEERMAISIMADLDNSANVVNYEIFPSIIRVNRQLTYHDANIAVGEDPELKAIYEMAHKFRNFRLQRGALQITIPEIHVQIDSRRNISINLVNRENPGRMMISECMILANWLAARFFRDHGQATIYRSQLPPRGNLIGEDGGTLYQNWMQRRLLSRVVLNLSPESHAGLGLDAYVTLTSPLRKYLDLVTQRQLRGLLGMERLYSDEELRFVIQAVEQPMSYITMLQQERTRYWILRHLESRVGQKEEALVLEKRHRKYVVLLTRYMMECPLPLNCGAELAPKDTVLVKIERVNARSNILTISLA